MITPDPRATFEARDVDARLQGLEDLSVDVQIRTLSGIEADLRTALDATRG